MVFIKKYFLPLLIFIFYLSLYIHNLSRSVYAGDSGDFITTSILGGVAHPPGYPLFTFLGFLLTKLHFWPSPAFAVGLISAFSGAFTLSVFFLLCKKLSKNLIISFIITFILGFTYLFWFYSEIAEVFILNALFAISLIYLAIIINEKPTVKKFSLFLFILGLSLTNHQTIILLLPTLLIILLSPKILDLFFDHKNSNKLSNKIFKLKINNILYFISFFLLGLLIYIYVPIASHFNPIINWDNVKDIKSFLHLLLRQDYGTFNAGSFNAPNIYERIVILKTYLLYIFTQLTPPVIFISILGFFNLFFKSKKLFFAFIIGFLISGPIFITYAGFPLLGSFYLGIYERFFILSAILILLFSVYGLMLISKILSIILYKNLSINVCLCAFLIIPTMLAIYNYPKTNLSNIKVGNNLGYNFLSYLPKNSIVILTGDTELFNTWYIHFGLNFRPDIKVVNLNGIYQDRFLAPKLEAYRKQNPKKNQTEIFNDIIVSLNKKYPVFSYSIIKMNNKNISWIPYGLLYEMTDKQIDKSEFQKNVTYAWSQIYPSLNSLSDSKVIGNYALSDLPIIYAESMLATGNYFYEHYKDEVSSERWYKLALITDPTYAKTYQVIGVYDLGVKKDCQSASKFLQKSINLDPFDTTSYFILYDDQLACLKDKNAAELTAIKFSEVFKSNFSTAFRKIIKKYE